jgi:hypothetical protein
MPFILSYPPFPPPNLLNFFYLFTYFYFLARWNFRIVKKGLGEELCFYDQALFDRINEDKYYICGTLSWRWRSDFPQSQGPQE